MAVTVILLISMFFVVVDAKSVSTSETLRAKILREEFEMSIGGKVILDEKENELNQVLMKWKHTEIDEWFKNSDYYNFSKSYFDYKVDIKKSPVYKFIRGMPKGALLHIHANAVLGPDFFLNVTYRNNLYVCYETIIIFKFAYDIPKDPCESQWVLMSELRNSMKDVKLFDSKLRKQFTLVGWKYSNQDDVWNRFGDIFSIIWPLWSHVPVWKDYVYAMLEELRKDNIMYVELRSSLPQMYDLNGNIYDEMFFVNTTENIVEKFKSEHSDFLGAKIICAFNRNSTISKIKERLNLTKTLQKAFPDFIAGFDLVSKEDTRPLIEFSSELEAAGLDYFFHAGETNWYGMETDENLIDAVALGAKRIGHGFALSKHPGVVSIVKQKTICIEACVVSNAALGLLVDMRSHPLSSWIAQGLPVTLAGDDPGLWDAHPLTTDFYVTFQGISSRDHDLRLLKQLALNSIQYSAMTNSGKEIAFSLFENKWKAFVNDFLETLSVRK